MLLAQDYRFSKTHRLLKRHQYLFVQQTGQKVTSRLFIALVVFGGSDAHPQLGVTITRRFGNAVARNHTRRLVREAFRTKRFLPPSGVCLVVLPKRNASGATTDEIFADLERLGSRIFELQERQ